RRDRHRRRLRPRRRPRAVPLHVEDPLGLPRQLNAPPADVLEGRGGDGAGDGAPLCHDRAVPLPTSLVGIAAEPATTAVDIRATMAYAAGIVDHNPVYLDTTRPGGVVAHPLFPVRLEWPQVLAAGRLVPPVLTRAEARAGLHLTHDLTIGRLVRPGD